MPKQHRRSLWKEFSSRGRMYLVLSLCCLTVALSSGMGLVLIGHTESEEPEAPEEQIVTESGYDRNANTIDTQQFSDTILPAGADAGEQYIQETLFLGDSNTARMYRLFDFCSYSNAIGSVGMAARSLANYACVGFEGYSNYQTMPNAVKLMQPQRVIITFGTNDLNPNTATDTFINYYATGIKAVQEAYPSVDIIVNSIPPLGRQHSGEHLTQKQIDEWNRAIVEMCEENGWKFLNSAEALKDEATGYARSGYVESDGLHLTRAAMETFFNYVRTHSYVTEDDRPPLESIPRHNDDRDVVVVDNALASPEPTAGEELPEASATPEPSATPEVSASPEPTGAPEDLPTNTPENVATQQPTEQPTEQPTAEPTAEPTTEPTAETQAPSETSPAE